MYFQELQRVCPLLVFLLKPGKCFVVVAKSQVGVHEGSGRNVACLSSSFQFRKQPKRVSASPGEGVRPNQMSNDGWTTVGNRNRFLQHWDRLLRVTLSDQRNPEIPQGFSVVWP